MIIPAGRPGMPARVPIVPASACFSKYSHSALASSSVAFVLVQKARYKGPVLFPEHHRLPSASLI